MVHADLGFWQGTAVAATFLAETTDDFWQVIDAIQSTVEGRRPTRHPVEFLKAAEADDTWSSLPIGPDVGALALDRNRAHDIGRTVLEPLLARGRSVILDFSNVGTASQAFLHALLWDALIEHGPDLVERLRFVACSSQVAPLVRATVRSALEGGVEGSP